MVLRNDRKQPPSCREERGFTLIELMIVITIIGILAGLAVPRFGDYISEAKKVEAVGFGEQVLNSFAVSAVRDGAYPSFSTCEEFREETAKSGFAVTQSQGQKFCQSGTALKNPLCRCWDTDGREIRWDCIEPTPPECKTRGEYAWYEVDYFLPMHEFGGKQILMLSTPGTVSVISESDIPPVGVVE